jgi:predicted transposase YbfD/YdcC
MATLMSESSIILTFSKLQDPRKQRNRLYTLEDLICTAILATLCRCDDYDEMSDWTEGNLDWLQSLGLCMGGAPSHDTYERFFRHLDSNHFQKCFLEWTTQLRGKIGRAIAIDGKTLRNAYDSATKPLHLVSAFATENALVLGQVKTIGKGGELAGIQQLLEILDLRGAVITIDAGGCHKVVTKKIIEKKGDYIICLKGNQGKLHDEAENFFAQVIVVDPEESGCVYWKAEETTRGRMDTREVWTSADIEWLPQKQDWAGLKSLVCVRRTTTERGVVKQQTRYFISSLLADAEHQGQIIRGHWSIENRLHWQLDVTYREDLSRVRKGNGAENLSVLRRATMNILRSDESSKVSLKRRRFRASLKREYLCQLLGVN